MADLKIASLIVIIFKAIKSIIDALKKQKDFEKFEGEYEKKRQDRFDRARLSASINTVRETDRKDSKPD